MRFAAKIILTLGLLMIMMVAYIAIDRSATPERRAALQDAIGEVASDASDQPHHIRRNPIGRFARAVDGLRQGAMYTAPITVADMLPPAPEGWVRHHYTPAHGKAITGEELVPGDFNLKHTAQIISRFETAAQGRHMGAAVTYARGDRLIAIRFLSELDRFRTFERGVDPEIAKLLSAPAKPKGTPVLARIDGIPVMQEPQFSADGSNRPVPVDYRHFTLDIGHVVGGAIITNASDADLVQVLSGIDIALVEDVLPRPTRRYSAGTGFEYLAAETPASDPPPPTVAWRAQEMLTSMDYEPQERDALEAIAQGRATDWLSLSRRVGPENAPRTERLIELLSPGPGSG